MNSRTKFKTALLMLAMSVLALTTFLIAVAAMIQQETIQDRTLKSNQSPCVYECVKSGFSNLLGCQFVCGKHSEVLK